MFVHLKSQSSFGNLVSSEGQDCSGIVNRWVSIFDTLFVCVSVSVSVSVSVRACVRACARVRELNISNNFLNLFL
jgi:hypothetical protein